MKQLSGFERRALTAIRDHEPIGTYQLAKLLWPDRVIRKPWLVVGSHVGGLVNKGWVWREYGFNNVLRGYVLTPAGRAVLTRDEWVRKNETEEI
jgi:hypothetical protein